MFDNRKIHNLCRNKELSSKELNDYKNYFYMFDAKNPNRTYCLQSEHVMKNSIRHHIVSTLEEIKFSRLKWTQRVVVAFIQETVFDYTDTETICERYTVSNNQIKRLVSTFVNLKSNHYQLNQYFTDYELTYIRYKNPKTLEKNLREHKISQKELNILEEMGFIIFDKNSNQYIIP